MILWSQKIKAVCILCLIYLPIMFIVYHFNSIFTKWVFDNDFKIAAFFSGGLWQILLKIFWIYIQAIIIYFYYRCFIGINKIFKNNKTFFLK